MPRQTYETRQRDAQAWILRQNRLGWAEIATRLGLNGESVARAAANRYARRMGVAAAPNPRRAAAGRAAALARFNGPPAPQPAPTGPRIVPLGDRTFGVEIEYRVARKGEAAQAIATALGVAHIHCFGYHGNVCETCGTQVPDAERFANWKIERDGSVTVGHGGPAERGGEAVSPILTLNGNGLEQIRKVLGALRAVGATVDRQCGLHMHIGVGDFTNAGRAAIVERFFVTQPTVNRFVAPQRLRNYYCKPLTADYATRVARALWMGDRAATGDKMFALNVLPYWTPKQTFEVRLHQGTLAYAKVKNWVGLMLALFQYAGTTFIPEAGNQNNVERAAYLLNRQQDLGTADTLFTQLVGNGLLNRGTVTYLTGRAEALARR